MGRNQCSTKTFKRVSDCQAIGKGAEQDRERVRVYPLLCDVGTHICFRDTFLNTLWVGLILKHPAVDTAAN